MDNKHDFTIDGELSEEFDSFERVLLSSVFQGTKENSDSERVAFVENHKNGGVRTNPQFIYPDNTHAVIEEREGDLIDFVNGVKEEPDEMVREMYEKRVREEFLKIEIMKASIYGEMDSFRENQIALYGAPEESIFSDIIFNIRAKYRKHLNSENEEIRKAAESLFSSLSHIPEQEELNHPLPSEGLVSVVRSVLDDEISSLVTLPEGKKEFTLEETKEIFEEALTKVGAEGWVVRIDSESGRTGISVIQQDKEIIIPVNRKLTNQAISSTKIKELLVHEIGTHVRRRVMAERGYFSLLEIGFEGYDTAEEGLAKLKEQVITEDNLTEYEGENSYLAAGLAFGTDGIPRDFYQTYDVLVKYFKLKALLGKDPSKADTVSSNNAWKYTLRAFRGTDSKTPGVCALDALSYMSGNVKIWEHIGQYYPDSISRIPQIFKQASIGKFDPTNPQQVEILTCLGLI